MSNKRVYLRKSAGAYFYNAAASYLVVHNNNSGRRNSHDVWVLTNKDPIVIGRELDLQTARDVIAEVDAELAKAEFMGDHAEAVKLTNNLFESKPRKARRWNPSSHPQSTH